MIVPAPTDLKAILINNNAAKTNSPVVDLTLSAQDVTEMQISNESDFAGASWEEFVTSKEWSLKDEVVGPAFGDGEKTVYVKFRDASLTESDVYSATIFLDTQPPVVGPVPLMVNGGSLRTTNRQVTLFLDASNAATVLVFNEDELDMPDAGTEVEYSGTIQWTLSEDNGTKTVYVVFIDDVGNRSSFFSDNITLTGQSVGEPTITEPMDGSSTTDHFVTVKGLGDPESDIQIQIEGEG